MALSAHVAHQRLPLPVRTQVWSDRRRTVQGISLVLYGLSMQRYRTPRLLDKVAAEIEHCGLQFSPHDLTAVMAAFAMSGFKDVATIERVMAQALNENARFAEAPQLLCSMLWAIAQLRVPSEKCASAPLPSARSLQSGPSGRCLTCSQLSRTALAAFSVLCPGRGQFRRWADATGGAACRQYAHKALPHIVERLATLTPRSLSNLTFALGILGTKRHPRVMDMIGLALCTQMPYTTGKQLGSIAVGGPRVLRWSPYRRASVSRAMMKQCVELICTEDIQTAQVRLPRLCWLAARRTVLHFKTGPLLTLPVTLCH